MATTIDTYTSVEALFDGTSLPSWVVDPTEQRRLAAYQVYEDIYWTRATTLRVLSRGADSKPIYIPTGRQIVETINRYVAPAMDVVADPEYGTPNDQALLMQVIEDLKRRERLVSKFNRGKRYGLMRGDWIWHVWADPLRQEGSRVSLYPIHPGTVFPIYQPDNIDVIIGYHIAEQIIEGDDVFISRKTYRKTTGLGGPSPITYEHAIYELDDWGGPAMDDPKKPVRIVQAPVTLPAPIDELPLYHIPNFEEDGQIWGSSEMRGLETIMAAINQNVSDEDLAIAMEGLGVYWTDAGAPVDDDGNDVAWNLGPGRVAEVPTGKTLGRIDGIDDVTPYQDHLKYLHEKGIDSTLGQGPVTKGNVDVQAAESGVALAIQFAPLLARAEEKDQIILDKMHQLLYGVGKWYSAYEGTAFNPIWEVARANVVFGPKLPPNEKQQVETLTALSKEKIIPKVVVRDHLRRMGYELPDEATIVAELTKEATAAASIQQDAFGSRLDQETDAFLGGE